jgi:peptidoglycan/xylan/chitin deacetylase (PgdA/CDA1 family)
MDEAIPVPVLMYHSISATASRAFRSFAVSPARFAEQMAYLHDTGYTSLTVSEYVRRLDGRSTCLPARPVVLTFDDGFADFTSHALPVLEQHGMTGTVYLATAYMGGTSSWLRAEGEGDRPMLTWEQVRAAEAAGVECGGHSHTHVELDTVSRRRVQEEVYFSKQSLERQLDHEVTTFAYPFGYHDAWSRQVVRAAGYTSACAVKFALSSTADDPYQLARVKISGDSTLERFVSLLEGRRVPVAPTRERLRTRVWGIVRRARAHLNPSIHASAAAPFGSGA